LNWPAAHLPRAIKPLPGWDFYNLPDIREVMEFIERRQLYERGCGLVDLTLLASVLVTPDAKLWTLDKRLAALAEECGVLHQPA
jgi:hypothetical protein